MSKRYIANVISKEHTTYKSNVQKYKNLMVLSEKTDTEHARAVIGTCEDVHQCDEIASTSTLPNTDQQIPKKTFALGSIKIVKIPKINFDVSKSTTLSKSDDQTNLLIKLIEGQKVLNSRLENIEKNQTAILQNQSTLSNEQESIVGNQQRIADQLKAIQASMVSKAEVLAQTKLLIESKVSIRRAEKSLRRMTGESRDSKVDEVASMLPLRSIEGVRDLEANLQVEHFAQAATKLLHKLKGVSEDASSVIRSLFTDDLLAMYNWEGRWGKESLVKLSLVNKILRAVFQNQGGLEFKKSMRKAVERSHNRIKQKKYIMQTSMVSKAKVVAKPKLPTESKVSIRRAEKSLRRMAGENRDSKVEVASMLPLTSIVGVEEVEENLQVEDFAQATTTLLQKLKGESQDPSSVIRSMFTDDLLAMYNWEGRWGKESLAKLSFVNKILRTVFQDQGVVEFKKSMRKAVERSHHRMKQKNYLDKKRKSIK